MFNPLFFFYYGKDKLIFDIFSFLSEQEGLRVMGFHHHDIPQNPEIYIDINIPTHRSAGFVQAFSDFTDGRCQGEAHYRFPREGRDLFLLTLYAPPSDEF